MPETKHPWQSGPTELISFALERLRNQDEFDQRLAFLLLDIGVETLFKTYLTLREKTTGTKLPYGERKEAIEGSFHELCEGIERAAPHRLQNIDFGDVEFYHDLRNKLYHHGNGITIPTDNALGYAKLAVDLLNRLLDVDLRDELRKPELEAKRAAEDEAKRKKVELEIQDQTRRVQQARRRLSQTAALAVEELYPQLCVPSFVNNIGILRFLAKLEREAHGEHFAYTEDEQSWRDLGSSLATPEVERARTALAIVGKQQGIPRIEYIGDIAELYLSLVEPIAQSVLGDEAISWKDMGIRGTVDFDDFFPKETPKPLGWVDGFRYSSDYPPDPLSPDVYWDDELQEAVVQVHSRDWVVPFGQELVQGLDKIRHQIEASSRDARFLPPSKRTGEDKHGLPIGTSGNRRQELYQEFFKDLLTRVKQARPGTINASKVSLANWFWFGAGRSGLYFGWSFGRGDVLRVELTLATQDKAINKRAFEALEKQRAEIEKEIGMPLIWEARPENVQKMIRVTHPGKITDEQKELESAKQWAVDTMVKFIDVFTPRIKRLEFQ